MSCWTASSIQRLIDAAFLDTPYYLLPDLPAAMGAYALIREAMLRAGRAGIGHIVLSGREWAALVVPKGRGLMLTTLRAAAEVRSEDTAFAELADTTPDAAMVEKATEIIARQENSFDPRRDFRERFQEALFQLVQAKLRGEKPVFPPALPMRPTAFAGGAGARPKSCEARQPCGSSEARRVGADGPAARPRAYTTAFRQ